MDTLKLLLRIVSAGTLVLGYGAWTWHAVRQCWRYRRDPYKWDMYDVRTIVWVAITAAILALVVIQSLVWAWS